MWEFDRDTVTVRAVCKAADDANCRLVCNSIDCEYYTEIVRHEDQTFDGETVKRYTHDECDAGMRPGECNVCLFLNEDGYMIPELATKGTRRFTLATVPIKPVWNGDEYEWEPLP